MEYKFEEKDNLVLAGIGERVKSSSMCVKLWDTLMNDYTIEQLISLGSGESYGVCYGSSGDSFSYFAGFDLDDASKVEETNLQIFEIPKSLYLIVKIKGAIPKAILEGFESVEGYLENTEYKRADNYDIEYYYEGDDMQSDDYEMELWVPVIKK